jgi:hypothetical protein
MTSGTLIDFAKRTEITSEAEARAKRAAANTGHLEPDPGKLGVQPEGKPSTPGGTAADGSAPAEPASSDLMPGSSADIYRQRADALRQMAVKLGDKGQCELLIQIADHYEQLARSEDKIIEFIDAIRRADGGPYPSDVESNEPG